jgi:TonB-dependent SusC/RagA subfamily outer membrane receptor
MDDHRSRRCAGVAGMMVVWAALGSAACAPARTAPAAPESRTEERTRRAGADTARTSVVSREEIDRLPVGQVEELLEGRAPGVRVVRMPGGGISIRMLGGPTTLQGSNEPLYVVDGMPVHVVPGRGLDWLNPRDIQRIEVLRDAVSLSMYGVRGANGVILITTRRGRR